MPTNKGNMYDWITGTRNFIRGACPHQCAYCMPSDTKILMSDFSIKDISEIAIGDKVVGIKKEGTKYYKFGSHVVLNIAQRIAKTIIITTEYGKIECTENHPLMGSTEQRSCTDWKSARAFSVYENLRFIGVPPYDTDTRDLGWLSGFCDGDGCFFESGNKKQWLGFEAVCIDEKLRNEFIFICKRFGVEMRIGNKISSKKSFNSGKPCKMVFSRKTENVKKLRKIIEFPKKYYREFDNFYWGYLAGMLDTDGSVSQYIRIAQSKKANPIKYNRIKFCCDSLNLKYREEEHGIRILGGFKNRVKLLFYGKPAHSLKSKNLLFGSGTKGSHISQIKKIEVGKECEVYNFETTSGNYIANGFVVHNCYVKKSRVRRLYEGPPKLIESQFKKSLGKDNFWFVGSMIDMFADEIPEEWILDTLEYCHQFGNKYLFQSKNPGRILDIIDKSWPLPDSIIGTTIETNRSYKQMGSAPITLNRALALMHIADQFETMVTIEPIMDFDLNDLMELVKICGPEWVNIGADSKNSGLPEPNAEKINELIKNLRTSGIDVKIKDNLKRLAKVK